MFSKKWLSLSLTAVLLAANISVSFTPVPAIAGETVNQQEYSVTENSADDTADAEEQTKNTDSSGADSIEEESAADSSSTDESSSLDEQTQKSQETSDTADIASSADTDESAEEEAAVSEGQESSAETESSDSIESDDDSDSKTDEEGLVSDQEPAEETVSEESSAAVQEDEGEAEQEAADNETSSDTPETTTQETHAAIIKEKEIEVMDPDDIPFSDSDNDEAFAGYVNREMELTGDLRADEGDIAEDAQKLEKNYASTSLTGYKRKLYDLLAAQICEVAAGTRTNTHFVITAEQLGLSGKKWTASDLGLTTLVDEDDCVTDEAWEALEENIGLTYIDFFNEILYCLLADYPYDLYWYDKTCSTLYSGFGYDADWENNQYVLKISSYYDYIDCYFPVCAEYSASGETGTYEADSSIGTAVSTAYNNADAIVSKYTGGTDYEKLDAYRSEICSRVSYNNDAAENSSSMDYGNPWLLIWVFDDDSSTNVVCEGYSKAFQYLCDLSSWNSIFAECISVTGYLDGEGHMWNIVSLLDDRSYLVDVTNCDSGTIGSGNSGRNLFLVGTGDPDSSKVYATGNIDDGYVFEYLDSTQFTYDSDTRRIFDDDILTLAEGRVDENTSVKPAQEMSASDISVAMFGTATPSVTGNAGTLQYTSTDTSVFTVNENSGKITPAAPGKAKLTITAQETDDYRKTSITVNVTVSAFKLTQADTSVTLSSNSYVYTGTARKPSITKVVDANGRTLTQNTDFTVSYSNNVNAGTNTAKVKITGQGNYTALSRRLSQSIKPLRK